MNEEAQNEDFFQRRLNWVDLVIALGGIAGIYVFLILATRGLARIFPHEQLVIYLNAFLTQLFFLFLILIIKKIRRWHWSDFGWRFSAFKRFFPTVLSIYALTWVINITYAMFLYQQGFVIPETDVYAKLLGQATWYTILLNLLLAGVLAPIVEETLFRGVIFGSLQTYMGKWTAGALSAAVFAGLHFQAYGFFPRFVLGMFLVFLVDKYKSIYPAVALHACNNIVATVLAASLLI